MQPKVFDDIVIFPAFISHVTRKPVFGVSFQVRHKLVCSATETSYSLKILDLASI